MTMLPALFSDHLFDVFDNSFSKAFDDAFFRNQTRGAHMMKTDVRETDNGYEISVDMPGYDRDEISLQLHDGYLTLSGNKNSSNDTKDTGGNFIRRERYRGSCSRTFYVGSNLETGDISAKLENGTLYMEIPKKKPEQIENAGTIEIR